MLYNVIIWSLVEERWFFNNMNMYQMEAMLGSMSGLLINVMTSVIATALSGIILTYAMRWFIFKKAGEKGWKGIIPFYSDYITYKIAWDGRIYVALLLGSIVTALLGTICGWIHPAFGAVISFICNVAVAGANAVAGMILQFKMARAFGQKDFFAVGLYFLGSVFSAILAFGDCQYRGPQVNDGLGVPKFISNAGDRAAAAAANAAANAAQQLQQRQAMQQQQQYQQFQQGGNAGTARQQAYQQQMQAYQQQQYAQAYQQQQAQRAGRRANANYDQYNQQ